MDADRILEKLAASGYTYTNIANALGVSPTLVSLTARRLRHSHRVAVAIATALEMPVDTVFPDIPMYHGPFMTGAEREAALARKLAQINGLRRSA